jgi:hypothetical protein
MPTKNRGGDDNNGKVRIRFMEVEIEGSNDTLIEGVKQAIGAIPDSRDGRQTGDARVIVDALEVNAHIDADVDAREPTVDRHEHHGLSVRAQRLGPLGERRDIDAHRVHQRAIAQRDASALDRRDGPGEKPSSLKAVRASVHLLMPQEPARPAGRSQRTPARIQAGVCDGKVTLNVLPLPTSLETSILPPWASTMRRAM